MKLELLRGNRILIWEAHGYDSQALHNALPDADFRELIVRGQIVLARRYKTVAEAFASALEQPSYRFTWHPEFQPREIRERLLAALAEKGLAKVETHADRPAPPLRHDWLAFIDRIVMLDALLALAPRVQAPPPGGFSETQSRACAQLKADDPVRAVLQVTQRFVSRSDSYEYVEGLDIPDTERANAKRYLDACYTLALAESLGAQKLVVGKGWPDEVRPARGEEAAFWLFHPVEREKIDKAFGHATSDEFDWAGVLEFVRRSRSDKSHSLEWQRFLAERAMEHGPRHREYANRVRLGSSAIGAIAWGGPVALAAHFTGQGLEVGLGGSLAGGLSGAIFGPALRGFLRTLIRRPLQKSITSALSDRPLTLP
jgi:hypothetical protein